MIFIEVPSSLKLCLAPYTGALHWILRSSMKHILENFYDPLSVPALHWDWEWEFVVLAISPISRYFCTFCRFSAAGARLSPEIARPHASLLCPIKSLAQRLRTCGNPKFTPFKIKGHRKRGNKKFGLVDILRHHIFLLQIQPWSIEGQMQEDWKIQFDTFSSVDVAL